MNPFSRDYSNPRDQEIRLGKSPYEKTLGPYRESNSDPFAYRDNFVANLKKNNPQYNAFYSGSNFPSESAFQAQVDIDRASQSTYSNFANPFDKRLADDFLVKYTEGAKRQLINDPVFPSNLDILRSEQPPTAVNEKNSSTVGKFPNQGVNVG